MPSTSKTILKRVKTVGEWAAIVLCLPCLLCLLPFFGGKCGTANRKRNLPANPPLLPTPRIDIRRLPVAEQPQICLLLKLPLELRESIYEHVLGRRLISLDLVRAKRRNHLVVTSKCYAPIDDLDPILDNPTFFTDRISPALLLSCRQVYDEALPILHRRNTFHFPASYLEVIVQSALGRYSLPDIRSVHLQYYPEYDATVVPLLHRMRLERLALTFEGPMPQESSPDPYGAVLERSWARDILTLRNLRRLEFWFESEHPVYNKHLAERFRQLMIGPGADERYGTFLENFNEKYPSKINTANKPMAPHSAAATYCHSA